MCSSYMPLNTRTLLPTHLQNSITLFDEENVEPRATGLLESMLSESRPSVSRRPTFKTQ